MLHVVRAGSGPRILLIHGSAADHTTWSIQLASRLCEHLELVAYDRPITATIEEQADIAMSLAPDVVVGSSFGAVVALEVIRRREIPAVLLEPPMGASDDAPAAPLDFLVEYDRRAVEQGGPAAAEFFLRTVLG